LTILLDNRGKLMYIILSEDGSPYQTDTITEDEFQACDDGYLTILDAINMTDYYRGQWTPITRWG